MNIIKYVNYSDRKVVNKSLKNLGYATIDYRDVCDYMRPTIMIKDYTMECNYIYIQEYRAYYYITNKRKMRDIWLLDLEIDVLMTAKNDINNTTALVTRQEYNVAEDIQDNEIVTDCTIDINNIIVGQSGSNNYKFYLSVIGV